MMVSTANQETDAGSFPSPDGQVLIHAGGFLKDIRDVEGVVVGVFEGRPVYLRDVASISDGPCEADHYVFFGTGPAARGKGITVHEDQKGVYPAVTVTIAKRKGTNAISVANKVLARIEKARGTIIPDNIHMTITRHYGQTAKEKSDELLFHMMIAIVSVTALTWIT